MTKKEQSNEAMDQLFSGLTSPSTHQNDTQKEHPEEKLSYRQKKYKEENERVCTIMDVEDMNKLRYIAGKEGFAIRELFGISVKKLIKEYEENNGPIRVRKTKPKKGDVSKVFKI